MELSSIFNKRTSISNIWKFIVGVYHSGKYIEFMSFLIWELKYKLSLYKSDQIIKFTDFSPVFHLTKICEQIIIKENGYKITNSITIWSLLFIDDHNHYWGTILNEPYMLYKNSSNGEKLGAFKFNEKITGIYISKANIIFCCSGGKIFKSSNDNTCFVEVMKLSNPESFFRFNTFTETPTGELFIGEYGNIKSNEKWTFVGYIYYSIDSGNNWQIIDFLKNEGINKHIHILQWSYVINGLILTDGDNFKNLWINLSKTQFGRTSSSEKDGWKKINFNHIDKGGYTGFVELENKIFLGTDYNGGTNFLVSSHDLITFNEKVLPDPYRRSIFDRIIKRQNKYNKIEIWSLIQFKHSKKVKSLIMVSIDDCKNWKKIIEFDGTQFEICIISNSMDIAKEIYFEIKSLTDNKATTIFIHD